MPKAIILKGLPASGKTTYAVNILAKKYYVYFNNDDIRNALTDGKYSKGFWSPKLEKDVKHLFYTQLNRYIVSNFDIILDNTYLNPKTFNKDYNLLKEKGYEIEVVDLTNVPLETCIQRDIERKKRGERSVGTDVIMEMWSRYIKPTIPPLEFLPNKKSAIICDLDGTLAILNGRNPYDASNCDKTDTFNPAVVAIINAMVKDGYHICFTSGRNEKDWDPTVIFLSIAGFYPNFESPYHLYMRREDSRIDDTEEKLYLYKKYIEPQYNIEFAIDDRMKVCRLWKTLGIPVFNCGDYYEF